MRDDPTPHLRWLVGLYPKSYRERYGDQIAQTAADMEAAAATPLARVRVRARLLVDLPASALVVRLQHGGDSMTTVPPAYVTRSSRAALALMTPFVVAVVSNALAGAFTGQDLHGSWLWSTPVLATWVLALPLGALVISLGAYVAYTAFAGGSTSRLRRAVDVPRLWPLLLPLAVAAGVVLLVLFHDSAHCWTQNPIDSLTHWNRTWSCTRHGFLGG